jgi:hypothetical protein
VKEFFINDDGWQVTKTSNSMMQEFRAVLAQGGVKALYRGLLPNFAKSAPAVSIR